MRRYQTPKSMTKLSEYVKVAEADKILGVSQNTVRSWFETGSIPSHRNPANGYRLFHRDDLEAFLHQAVPTTKRLKQARGRVFLNSSSILDSP